MDEPRGRGVSRMIEMIQVSILNPHTLLLQNEAKRIVVCFDSLQKKIKGEVVWYKICKNKAEKTVVWCKLL